MSTQMIQAKDLDAAAAHYAKAMGINFFKMDQGTMDERLASHGLSLQAVMELSPVDTRQYSINSGDQPGLYDLGHIPVGDTGQHVIVFRQSPMPASYQQANNGKSYHPLFG